MSDDYFKSSSDSFSSSSDYKPSGYTDFSSSNSYNFESESSKKYDDYSSFSSDNTNTRQQSSFYSFYNSESPRNSYDSPYSDSSYPTKDNLSGNYDSLPMHDDSMFGAQKLQSQPTMSSGIPATAEQSLSTPLSQISAKTPIRKVQNFTVRDVLELPVERQEYLKHLPMQNLKLEPQFTAVMKRPQVVLGIADYYEKIITDQNFNYQVKSLKQGKQLKEVAWLTSLLTYFWFSNNSSKLTGKLQAFFTGRHHILIPAGLTGLMILDNIMTKEKTQNFVYDQKNAQHIEKTVRKFICQASNKEKMVIFGQA